MSRFIDIMADCFFTEYEENIAYEKAEKAISDHDKQIRNEVIEEIEKFVNGICEYPPTSLLGKKEILDKLKRMKGEQND